MAFATALERHLNWRFWLPAYTVASYVAISRLHDNVHYLSDVMAGSTIGIVAGRTVTRHGRTHFLLKRGAEGRCGHHVRSSGELTRQNHSSWGTNPCVPASGEHSNYRLRGCGMARG